MLLLVLLGIFKTEHLDVWQLVRQRRFHLFFVPLRRRLDRTVRNEGLDELL
jgi:hypothetical protein